MMKNLNKNHYYLITAWFIINLLQSIFTGLHSDESYYWMFSQNLAWGYFDHPPMSAFFIHLGSFLLPGELGVRLFIILVSTLTFSIFLNELNEQKNYFFLTVFILSFPLIHTHIAGFLAIPDIPLLLFVLLFLVLYRKFLQNPNLKLSVLLAMVTAAMIYSKYHAFMVLGLTVLSNLKLLRNKYFCLTVIITLLLLFPHVWWQIENEFPTFRYHLVERAKPFRLKYVFPNLINQYLMLGPLTGILIFLKLFRFKIKTDFDRALVFNIIGFYVTFFLLSFKNRIEAHWSAGIIPMIMLITYPMIKNDPKFKIWFKRLAVPVIILMFLFRIYLALDTIPNVGHAKITFYNREAHAMEIKKMAQGKKVGFYDNYAAISNYIFYTGDSAVLLSTPTYRFCQYDLWNEEKYAEGETVFAVQSRHFNPPHLTKMATGEMKGYIIIEEFQSLINLEILPGIIHPENGEYTFELVLKNNNNQPVVTTHVSNPLLCIMQNHIEKVSFPLSVFSVKPIEPGESIPLSFSIPENELDASLPLTFYTRTKNNFRGELISFHIH